jgi:KDO2-lipid IV(A) lauroyltransferase
MSSPSPSLWTPRHWPAQLGVAALKLAARIPWSWQLRIGPVLGRLLMWVARGRRRVAARNLELVFPALAPADRARLLREHFAALGTGAFEFARAWFGSEQPWRRGLEIEGIEHLQALAREGRGVLLVSGHFTTLEACGRLLTAHVPVAGMYRAHDEPVMEAAVLAGRLRYACAMFKREELRAAIRHLKGGGILWYAPDQDMLGKDTVFVPFFGIPAASITATHQLARLSGAAVVPFFHRREGARYVLRIGQPLSDFPSADAAADTARVNTAVEAMVREAPAQYLWVHKRYKRRPPGEPPVY